MSDKFGSLFCRPRTYIEVLNMNAFKLLDGRLTDNFLSVSNFAFPAEMAECYDVDVERTEEVNSCPSTSTLPFGMGGYGKPHGPPNPVAMFYPQLNYDLHPLLLNQRRRSSHDKDPLEPEPSPLGLVSSPMRQSYKQKQKSHKRRTPLNDQVELSVGVGADVSFAESTPDLEAPDYSAKSRKSFFCRACGKAFKFQTSLLRHNNKVHISKYQCPTCSRVFSRQAYLDVHTSKQGSSCYLGSGYAGSTVSHSPKSDTSSNLSNMK